MFALLMTKADQREAGRSGSRWSPSNIGYASVNRVLCCNFRAPGAHLVRYVSNVSLGLRAR